MCIRYGYRDAPKMENYEPKLKIQDALDRKPKQKINIKLIIN